MLDYSVPGCWVTSDDDCWIGHTRSSACGVGYTGPSPLTCCPVRSHSIKCVWGGDISAPCPTLVAQWGPTRSSVCGGICRPLAPHLLPSEVPLDQVCVGWGYVGPSPHTCCIVRSHSIQCVWGRDMSAPRPTLVAQWDPTRSSVCGVGMQSIAWPHTQVTSRTSYE